MATRVTIIKQPLYGTVVWTGQNFVYTPNTGFAGKDYYVFTETDGITARTTTNYVDTVNTAPVANNVTLTANATDVVTINVNNYISDVDELVAPLKLINISPVNYGKAYINGNNIVYTSNGYNSEENFTYTISDGQYKATANVKITTINGADTVIPTAILDSVDEIQQTSTIISGKSANWDSFYTFISGKSANWNQIDNVRYDSASTIVESNSSNWVQMADAKSSYDSATTVVSSNSANWGNVVNKINELNTTVSVNSSKWDQSSSVVQGNSGSWSSNYSSLTGLSSDYYQNKPTWNSLDTFVKSNSASWDKTELTNNISSNSGEWESSYTVVSQNSAKWDTSAQDISALKDTYDTKFQDWTQAHTVVSSNSAVNWNSQQLRSAIQPNSANWDSTYNTLTASSADWSSNYNLISSLSTSFITKSANWDSTYTTVNVNSGNWEAVYTNFTSNSSKWLYGASDINFTTNNLTAFGNVIVAGSLSAAGGVTETSTSIVSTSAFDVVNIGSTTALNVTKTQSAGAIATFSIGGSPVLYVSPSGAVGINTSFVDPNIALTVVGDISASGTVYGAVPPEYAVFQSNSAKYEASNTYFSTLCGLLTSKPSYDNSVTYVGGVSANLNTFLTLSAPLYNSAYTVVTGQSANNATSFTTLQTVSSKFGTDTVYRSVSGNYENAFNYISATSAAWITNNPKFTSLSASVLTSGNVYLTNAVLTSFTTPITASEDFLSISVNGQNRLVQLWNS
jgi:hypothetical protein